MQSKVDSFIYCDSCSSAVARRGKSRVRDYSIPSSRSKGSLTSWYGAEAKFNLCTFLQFAIAEFRIFQPEELRWRVATGRPRNSPLDGDGIRPSSLIFAGDCPGRILIGRIFLSLEEMPQVLGKSRLRRRSFCENRCSERVFPRGDDSYVFQVSHFTAKVSRIADSMARDTLRMKFPRKVWRAVFVSCRVFLNQTNWSLSCNKYFRSMFFV